MHQRECLWRAVRLRYRIEGMAGYTHQTDNQSRPCVSKMGTWGTTVCKQCLEVLHLQNTRYNSLDASELCAQQTALEHTCIVTKNHSPHRHHQGHCCSSPREEWRLIMFTMIACKRRMHSGESFPVRLAMKQVFMLLRSVNRDLPVQSLHCCAP